MTETESFITKIFELYGGKDAFFSKVDKEFNEFNQLWNQDTEVIGKVLRSHLIVEHYLTKYLQYQNKNIGSIDKAKLSFHQKVQLLNISDQTISFLIPGIIHINRIRNRLAHNLEVLVNEDDKKVFLSIGLFKAMRDESEKRQGKKKSDPLSIYEDFSVFAATLLQHGSVPESEYWKQATMVLNDSDFD